MEIQATSGYPDVLISCWTVYHIAVPLLSGLLINSPGILSMGADGGVLKSVKTCYNSA